MNEFAIQYSRAVGNNFDVLSHAIPTYGPDPGREYLEMPSISFVKKAEQTLANNGGKCVAPI